MSTNSSNDDKDYTRFVIRRLTRPLIHPPSTSELAAVLMEPWPIRVTVDATDLTTMNHWKGQNKHTPLFQQMFEWPEVVAEGTKNGVTATTKPPPQQSSSPSAHLHPFFSFGDPSSPFFFNPWQDVGNCLRNLLLHQVASHQNSHHITLSSHEVDLFVSLTNTNNGMSFSLTISPHFYLLRCHYDKAQQHLVFGYHQTVEASSSSSSSPSSVSAFIKLQTVSLQDENWRLTTCIILSNLARILSCLKDFAIPLEARPEKLSLVAAATLIDDANNTQQQQRIQKVYDSKHICKIFGATVANMIRVYATMKTAGVPHTDQVVSVVEQQQEDGAGLNRKRIVQFAPVGRSYLPENFEELLDALICVGETLQALASIGIMHRDIRWANVFHALDVENANTDGSSCSSFTREWVLFDFEYAAWAPQEAFPAHTLTPGNHAPEMILHEDDKGTQMPHDTAVDIWGLGYLIQHAKVDVPESHASDVKELERQCLQPNPRDRPTAMNCLERLQSMQQRPRSFVMTL